MGTLIDLVKKLIEMLQQLISKKCECADQQEYEQIISELNEIIQKLQDWAQRAGAGTLGEHAQN